MKLKIIGTQVYDDYEDKVIQEFDNVKVDLKEVGSIEYENNKIIYDKNNKTVEIQGKNNIVVELNKEKILKYNTEYGIINLKTFGKEIQINENPFRLFIKYSIKLNEVVEYDNILEIVLC